MALAGPSDHPDFFEYFLNPAQPQAWDSAGLSSRITSMRRPPTPEHRDWQYTFFDQADGF